LIEKRAFVTDWDDMLVQTLAAVSDGETGGGWGGGIRMKNTKKSGVYTRN